MGEGGGEGGTATAAPRLSRCRDRRDSPATGAAGARCAHKAFAWALFLRALGAGLRGAAPGPRPGPVGGGLRVSYRDRGLKGRRGPGQEPSRGLWGGGGCVWVAEWQLRAVCRCEGRSWVRQQELGCRCPRAFPSPHPSPTRPCSPLRLTAARSWVPQRG